MKHILGYLVGTLDYALFYPWGKDIRKNVMQLLSCSDSNWASDFDTHHSTSGNCFFLGNKKTKKTDQQTHTKKKKEKARTKRFELMTFLSHPKF